jgi:hypothetical protein
VLGDTDSAFDIYERSGGSTSHVSTGANGASDAFFDGNSADGSRVFFSTDESLAAGDSDSNYDIYERSGGATTRLSTGSGGGTARSTRPIGARRPTGRTFSSRPARASTGVTPTAGRSTSTTARPAARRLSRRVRRL